MQNVSRYFRFKVTPAPAGAPAFIVAIHMAQSEFEDTNVKLGKVHAAIKSKGFDPARVVWGESPLVGPALESALLSAIGASPGAAAICKYPQSWRHSSYKRIAVGGIEYVYEVFDQGGIVKYAEVLDEREAVAA